MKNIGLKSKAFAVAASLAMLSSSDVCDAAQTPLARTVELSAAACARGVSQRQIDELIRFMARDDQTPAATGCYWALNEVDRVRVSDAFVLAMGYPKEKLEADQRARTAPQSNRPVAPLPRTRPGETSGAGTTVGIMSTYWADQAERVVAGNGVSSTGYRYSQLCDSPPGGPWDYDDDWEYDFPMRVYEGEAGRVSWFATNWWVDSWLSGYPQSKINSYGYYGDSVTWVCLGTRAYSAGLDNVRNHLKLWVRP